jgi:pilus assembly protein Flp/PilA
MFSCLKIRWCPPPGRRILTSLAPLGISGKPGLSRGAQELMHYIWSVRNRARDDEGATAVEYGLMVAAIAAVIVLVVFLLGKYVFGAFSATCNGIKDNSGITVQNADCNK